MLKNKMMYAICSLSFLLFVGCRVQTEYVGTEKELTGNIEEIKQNNFQKIEYTNMPMDMYGFAAGVFHHISLRTEEVVRELVWLIFTVKYVQAVEGL